jgi:hypothetical protein
MYNKYFETYEKLRKEKVQKERNRIIKSTSSYVEKETMWLSKAKVCDDETDLKVITTNFGDHSSGLNFNKNKNSFKDFANASNVKSILFFYKEIQQFDCDQFKKITDKMKEDKKQSSILWTKGNADRRAKESQENLDLLNKVFLA